MRLTGAADLMCSPLICALVPSGVRAAGRVRVRAVPPALALVRRRAALSGSLGVDDQTIDS